MLCDFFLLMIFSCTDRIHLSSESEFTEKEIEGAFQFIDLDKNGFIGLSEIRHILICMGELITDEEVNEMMKMCDDDGDGQISLSEFRIMVINPDPSRPMERVEEKDPKESTSISEEERRELVKLKQQKKQLMSQFQEDNEFQMERLNRIFAQYQNLEVEEEAMIDIDEFAQLFQIDLTGQYRKLFELFAEKPQDNNKAGEDKINIKEFLLGLCNFISADKTERVKFCFKLFDDDHNGYITEDELINILKANHLSTPAQVERKAKTILKQMDDDGDNRIDLQEFLLISKKFPNILFPPN